MHLLRYLCHDDARFFRILRTYQQQFGGRTARTADLQRLFEAELGQPLDYFFNQWYRGSGYPIFDVRWNQAGSTLLLQVGEATTVGATPTFFQTEVDYQLTFQDGSTRLVRLTQEQASQDFAVPVSGTVAAITVDPAGWLPDLPGAVQHDNSLASPEPPTLLLYPNPAHEQLTINDLASEATAEVYDATARVVLRQPVRPAQPQVATQLLAPGLYLLRLSGAAGEALGQGRFVKQ